ncbi:hypothetical protein BN1723_003172, partial [Verticillium longisporum]
MEARTLARPAASLLTTTLSPAGTVARRSHQTWSRTKRALNIAPHPSFAPAEGGDTIIFNPPAAEPSIYHTPYKFLPKSDPRRKHADLSSLFAAPSSRAAAAAKLPPALNVPSRNPRYHLNKDDVAEIRRLRAEDPVQWSVNRLAQKFDCSEVFITICTPAPREHTERLERKLDAVKNRWGAIRTKARTERTKRKDMLFRGEL